MKNWIEVSTARLRHNLAAIRAVAGPRFEVLAVVKADAYGHGAALCAPVLVDAGVRWLGVGDVEEGLRVRASLRDAGLGGLQTNLLVMCGFEPEDAAGIVDADLTPVVWTVEHVEALERAAEGAARHIAVHVEVDTGMARQGAVPGPELTSLLKRLSGSLWVRWEGTFTHLGSSEIVDGRQTKVQQERFREVFQQAQELALKPGYMHLGNSSAVDEGSTMDELRGWPGNALLMVRPGLALYGYTLELDSDAPLQSTGYAWCGLQGSTEPGALGEAIRPIASWKTRVIGVRGIMAGDTVGYGATFVAEGPMRLALLPVGYADGFRREASGGVGDGWVMIAGRRAPVVGRVSMNLTVVDVTEHAEVRVGDEVVLLGEGVTADDHARWCGTIPYEILCGMRGRRLLV